MLFALLIHLLAIRSVVEWVEAEVAARLLIVGVALRRSREVLKEGNLASLYNHDRSV